MVNPWLDMDTVYQAKHMHLRVLTMSANAQQIHFEQLVSSYTDDLFRFALWLCRDREIAQDLVQETMLRAWRSIDKLRDEQAVKPWLLTTLRRENARRFERKRLDLVDADEHQISDDRQPGQDDLVLSEQVREAMQTLPEKYREPIRMQVISDCSVKQIARKLGLTRSAVMTRLFRAREQLAQNLGGLIGTAIR